jgi:hypothetical protein
MATDTERVTETLRRSPGLDDDELVRQSGVEPRLMAQICRYLEILGRLRRKPGPDGKIINTLLRQESGDDRSAGV